MIFIIFIHFSMESANSPLFHCFDCYADRQKTSRLSIWRQTELMTQEAAEAQLEALRKRNIKQI